MLLGDAKVGKNIMGVRHEPVHAPDSIFPVLLFRVCQPRLSGGLDAHGIRVVWHHYAGAVGGAVGVHAGAGPRVVAGRAFYRVLREESGLSAAAFYAGAELLIGLGAFAVPKLFVLSERILLPTGQMDSFSYLLFSALALAISIFPWCVCMGTTFPFMMGYVREVDARNTESFSFLYLANVLGAMSGTFCTAVVLVEMLGFNHTLWVAAAANFTIAFISAYLAWKLWQKKRRLVMTRSKSKCLGR